MKSSSKPNLAKVFEPSQGLNLFRGQGTRRAAWGVLRFDLGLIKTGIEFKQRLPIGRLGQPDEVARMALVLASDIASYVHGAAIPVDGGFLAA